VHHPPAFARRSSGIVLARGTFVPRPRATRALITDGFRAARHAQLNYVGCEGRGIRRIRQATGFRYQLPNGSTRLPARTLARIRALAIPPAWTDVWICGDENGHLQATGRDARGRKQYRYHPRWREVRDEAKYDDMLAFARALPRLRRRIARDLADPRLTKDKVVATILRIMELTAIRVGNDEYAAQNNTYGLTTLLDRHARVSGGTVSFAFRGKGNKAYRASIRDARLAAIVKRCRDVPGQRLFQYVDEAGEYRAVTSTDVNEYLRRATGEAFTAKTFRTWEATLLAAVLFASEARSGVLGGRRGVQRVIERVAGQLGNTAAVCRKSYVHPAVVEGYLAGTLELASTGSVEQRHPRGTGLLPEEGALVALLARQLVRKRAA
jgi:DNA topoisomerase-1